MVNNEIKIKITRGEEHEQARDEILTFLTKLSKEYGLNYYELFGILEIVKFDMNAVIGE